MEHQLTQAAVDSLSDEKGITTLKRRYFFLAVIGKQKEEICEIMEACDSTVKNNLVELYRKFGVNTRHELTGLVIKRMEEIAQWK